MYVTMGVQYVSAEYEKLKTEDVSLEAKSRAIGGFSTAAKTSFISDLKQNNN